jgi:site-specific recombinase XerD
VSDVLEGVIVAPGFRDEVELSGQAAWAFLVSKGESTREAYQRELMRWGGFCAEFELDVLAARRAHVDSHMDRMLAQGYKPATRRKALAAISGFYDYCVYELELLSRNPAGGVTRPRVSKKPRSLGLSEEAAHELRWNAANHSRRAEIIVDLMLILGMRVSGVCSARVEGFRMDAGRRVLDFTLKGGVLHTVPVPARLETMIVDYIGGRTTGPLVITESGAAMDRFAIWRLLKLLGGPNCFPHLLRHACVTIALNHHAALRDVQDLMAHADPATTRIYDDAANSFERSPVYLLEELFLK